MGQRKKRIEAKAKKRAVRVWKRSQIKEVLPEQKAESIVTDAAEEIDFHPIPPVPEEYRGCFPQPDRSEIHVCGAVATMSFETYLKLRDYTLSDPTLSYPGKMWRAFCPITKRFILRFCMLNDLRWARIEVAGHVWHGGLWTPLEEYILIHGTGIRETVATHLL